MRPARSLARVSLPACGVSTQGSWQVSVEGKKQGLTTHQPLALPAPISVRNPGGCAIILTRKQLPPITSSPSLSQECLLSVCSIC